MTDGGGAGDESPPDDRAVDGDDGPRTAGDPPADDSSVDDPAGGDRDGDAGGGDGDPGAHDPVPGRSGSDDAAAGGRDEDATPGRPGPREGGTDDGRTGDAPDEGADDGRTGDPPGDAGPPSAGGGGADPGPPPAPSSGESGDTPSVLVQTVREVVTSVGAVVVVGLVLFALSGIWPPLVAIESGSMEPHMFKGDLVFVVEDGRYAPADTPGNTGVVTHRAGNETGYWSFGDHGNVVVYRPNGRDGTPIIHRARFYVEEGENWVAQANPRYTAGASCAQLRSCPAPHDGFITKGDNNGLYDQVAGRSTVVKPEWIRGVAKVRVPYLGCIRLQLSGDSCLA